MWLKLIDALQILCHPLHYYFFVIEQLPASCVDPMESLFYVYIFYCLMTMLLLIYHLVLEWCSLFFVSLTRIDTVFLSIVSHLIRRLETKQSPLAVHANALRSNCV